MDVEVLLRFVLGVLIGACIWAIGNRAHADSIPATPTTQTQPATAGKVCWWNFGNPVTSSTGADTNACAASAAAAVPAFQRTCNDAFGTVNYDFVGVGVSPTSASITRVVLSFTGPPESGRSCTTSETPNWSTTSNVTDSTTQFSCPSGWTLEGTNCTLTTYSCPSGYTLNGTVCEQNLVAEGTEGPQLCIPETSSPGNGACHNGTLYEYRTASNQFAIDGVQQWCGPTLSTGQACTGSTPQGVTGSPTSCPAGQVPGLINGQTVCFSAGDSNPAVSIETQKQTTTDTQGQTSTTRTTTRTTDRGPGGATTEKTTTNPDGSTSTTTTNANPGANRTEMQRFCEQNPEVTICRRSTWAGACGAFACDGDAVQCAIAREMHQRNCQLFESTSALSDLGNAVAAGNDPQGSQNPALEANRQSISLPGTINQDSFLAAGGLSDEQIVVSPSLTVTLPWSQLNYYLSLMGSIVVAFAMVFAARLVVGAR